jgi:hypothetical protein
MHARTLYAAKCYWPGVTEGQLEQATVRAAAEARTASRAGAAIAYLGAIVFPDDELVLCLFDAGSRAAVRRTTELAAIPRERVMHSHWLPCHPPAITGRAKTASGLPPDTSHEMRDSPTKQPSKGGHRP